MYVRWRPDDDLDHTIKTQMDSETAKSPRLGEWLGVEPFDIIEKTVNVVHFNYGL